LLAACTPKGEVTINTSGIFKPLLYSIDQKDASGTTLNYKEILLSDEPLVLDVQIYNDSSFPYTDIELIFSNSEGSFPSISFSPSTDGSISFPGMDGTCSRTLLPKKSCLMKLILAPRDEKNYTEYITLKFKNYVDVEEHKATLVFLAGWPASLVFTNDKTEYAFGEELGINPTIPVVEREDLVTYTETFTMVNAGGLTAKNVMIKLHETCVSDVANHCPDGMFGAYSLAHNCPSNLGPGETCDFTVSYEPKNKNPESGETPEEIKRINYKSNLVIDYIKDPRLSMGALNAYFNSWSRNIQADFISSVKNLIIPDPLVVGNRESRNFRVSNNGLRDGELKFLSVRDISGSILANCQAVDSSGILKCFKNSIELSLSDFPFTIKDNDQCLPTDESAPKYIDVGGSCSFDIIFQPSTSFLEDRLLEYQNLGFELTFDARWKAQEKIEKKSLLSYSAQSKASARLVVESIFFASASLPFTPNPATVDLGRLALQSKLYTQRKPFLITFKNIGSEPARAISLEDGKGQNIPLGGSTHLGTGSYQYFKNVSASSTTCSVIAPQDSCTMSAMFAPIGINETEERNQMYDVINEDDILQSFKEFRIKYDSGSRYTDENRVDDIDFVTPPTPARIKAQLIRKGLMMDLTNDSQNVNQLRGVTAGDEAQTLLYLRNIGTGNIPYIRLLNPPSTSAPYKFIETTNPAAHAADYDCLDFVDTSSGNVTPYWPIPGGAAYQALPPDKSCVFTISHQKKNSDKVLNTISCNQTPMILSAYTAADINRVFSRSVNDQYLWSFCPWNFQENMEFSHLYFDGDMVQAGRHFGTDFLLPNYTVQVLSNSQAYLAPTSYEPALTATLLRPEINYPALLNTSVTAKALPELWFYGVGTQTAVTMNSFSASTIFMRGDYSREVVKLTSAYGQKSDFDYIYYVGSFTKETPEFQFRLPITNVGSKPAVIKSATVNVLGPAFSSQNSYQINKNISSGTDAEGPIFKFNPTVGTGMGTEEQHMEISVTYTNSRSQSPLLYRNSSDPSNLQTTNKDEITLKILVVGLIENDYPKLTLVVNDVDVTQNVGAAPTETILPATSKTMSWNEHPVSETLTFDTIQLSAAPKIEDSFAKKILTFKNTSSRPIQDLRIMFRGSSTSFMPQANKPSFKLSGSCTQGINLAPLTGSCQVILFFQPDKSDLVENFLLSAVYQTETNKYVMQNIGIELYPRAPGQILAPQFLTEMIDYKSSAGASTITRPSYPLEINNSPSINEIPTVFGFTGSKKILLTNNEGTKASLLLAYQRNLAKNSLRGFNPASSVPVSTIPEPSEYVPSDGGDYVVIHEIRYPDKKPRVQILATKGCLFGDDENNDAIPYFEKGFNKQTSTPCYLNTFFYANFDYINKKINSSAPLDMMNVASELWYFSVKRSSTASLWFHYRGELLPSTSLILKGFRDIQPLDTKKVFFTLPQLEGTYSNLGEVVGVRVLMSKTKADLDKPYATTLKYKDFRVDNPEQDNLVEWSTDLSNSQYVYFRAVAIRKHEDFVDSVPPRFVGLGANEYLSATDSVIMSTIVPPQNYFYFQDQKILVQKNLANANPRKYSDADTTCKGITVNIANGASNVSKKMTVINEVAWNAIYEEPSATSYPNLGYTTHWLSDSVTNLSTILGSYPEYDPNVSVKFMDLAKILYMVDDATPSAKIMKAKGGVPGGTQPFWSSYISSSLPLGSTRCMASGY